MSEKYIVSARKYRPSTFGSVVGQDALSNTLKNAISTGRLAQAYLFCGPRGVGKTSCARIFAKTINCMHRTPEGEACGECESCRDFASGVSYNVIELDAASNNGVDHIRDLTEQVNVPPQVGKYRVFIIDEVHMLSPSAFNAFLKTLEEPPSYAVFILATTEKNKVLPTILSRCQIFDFHRISNADIVAHLQSVAASEGISAEEAALDVIARKSDGAMRDALSIFDQISAASGGNITYASALENLNVLDADYFFRFVDCFRAGDVPGALMLYKEVRDKGFDSHFFLSGLASHVRDLMVALVPQTFPLLEVSETHKEKYLEQSKGMDAAWYYRAMKILSDCDLNYRISSNKQLLVELALIELCGMNTQPAATSPAKSGASPVPRQPESARPVTRKSAKPQTASPEAHQASQPRPAVSPRPVSSARSGVRSLRLTGQKPVEKAEQADDEPAPVGKRDNPYSKEQLADAWREYIEANPQRRIIVSTMRAGSPRKTDEGVYTVDVPNPGVLNEFESGLPHLVSFLRDRLGNDNLRITLHLIPASENVRSVSPAERLKEIVKNNPSIGTLLQNLDAELI